MTKLRATFLAAAALGICAVGAMAQSPGLPPGLLRQGGVIMMQPIQDSDQNGPTFSSERRLGLVHILSATDHDLYERAFDAADRGDWTAAKGVADQGHDATARHLIQFRYLLDKNSGASFGESAQFLKDNPDWPSRDTLFARAEAAMDSTMDPRAIIAWFGDRSPASAIGNIRLGEALIATNSLSRGRELVRQGWIEGSFDPNQELQTIQKDGSYLTPEMDSQRLNRLLWANDAASARREISRVDVDDQRVGEARLQWQLETGEVARANSLERAPSTSLNSRVRCVSAAMRKTSPIFSPMHRCARWRW